MCIRDSNELGMDDLSPDLLDGKVVVKPASTDDTPKAVDASNNEDIDTDVIQPGSADVSSTLVGKSLKEIERWTIEHTLTLANHNREETARILGISERNLYRKLREYELK